MSLLFSFIYLIYKFRFRKVHNERSNTYSKKEFVNRYKKGYPLILEEALENSKVLKDEGQLITLVDKDKTFLGKGIMENKIKAVAGF